ncbi:putative reverse transcriptase domain-containing protein [Tanacetum coccineum]
MAPKRATRSTPVTTTPAPTTTTTTSVTNAQLQAMIDQGVTAANSFGIAEANRNGDDSHTSGTGTQHVANSHVMTVSHDAAYAMTWADLRKKMTDKYCPRNEMKKLEAELMFLEESDKIERSVGNANNANNQRGTRSGQKPTCFECGVQGHDKRECPKLKNNKNHGNQVGNDKAPAKVYVVGRVGTNPDSNFMTGMFLLNNRYASILFDTGTDRSFVSTAFSSQMDITPSTLDHYYDVELADGRIIGLNTILRGDTRLGLHLSRTQNIKNTWPKDVKSYEHVTTNEVEDKSEKKRLEDVPIVQDFPEVFS